MSGYEARVARGIALLDECGPKDWRSKIDLDTLDIASPWRCVLGQLYGSFGWGLGALSGAFSCRLAAHYGFTGDTRVHMDHLTGAWREALTNA